MVKNLLIIGNNAAGVTAASYARRADRSAQVMIIERGKEPAYSRCSLPYVIEGKIPSFNDITTFPFEWYRMNKIDLLTETTATGVDLAQRKVIVKNKDDLPGEMPFDTLIICTGAESATVPVAGNYLPEVFPVRTRNDGIRIWEAAKRFKAAVVIGARLVGLEMAAALNHLGLRVSVVELLPQILDGIFDSDFATTVQREMETRGIAFYLNSPLKEIRGRQHVESVVAGDSEISCDMVIMAAGVRANTDLARAAGIEISSSPTGIKVNQRMETSAEGIYAAGDCVICSSHLLTGRPTLSQLGTVATRQGKVAGINAAGGTATFPPVLGTCVTKVFDIELAATGLTEGTAKKMGIDCISVSAVVPGRPHYLPEKISMKIKLVASKTDRRILGAQIMGPKEAALRAEILSLGISKGLTVDELSMYDNCYCPPVLDTLDASSIVADLLVRRLGH